MGINVIRKSLRCKPLCINRSLKLDNHNQYGRRELFQFCYKYQRAFSITNKPRYNACVALLYCTNHLVPEISGLLEMLPTDVDFLADVVVTVGSWVIASMSSSELGVWSTSVSEIWRCIRSLLPANRKKIGTCSCFNDTLLFLIHC